MSDITETIEAGQLTSTQFTQEREVSADPFGGSAPKQAAASSSQQQPASSSVVNLWQTSMKLKRCGESSSNVERSLLRGKTIFNSGVCHHLNMKKIILSERKNLHGSREKKAERTLQGECVQLRENYLRLWCKWTEKSWTRRTADIAQFETHQQLESQRWELYRANRWADQAQRENSKLESTKKITQEIVKQYTNYEEFVVRRRIYHAEERNSLYRESAFVSNSGAFSTR